MPQNSIENNKYQIKNTVEDNFSLLTCYLASTQVEYPRCCKNACTILQSIIKQKNGIDLKICKGTYTNISKHEECAFHVWLEYEDLIIDPTDYQFQVIDLCSLPFTQENILPENNSLINIPKEEWQQKMMDTYLKNAYQRYLEQPNEKEKYFLELKKLLVEKKLTPDIFVDELKRCFKSKIFYHKNDLNNVYKSE